MVQIEVIENTFDKSNTKKIYDVLELVSFNQPTPKISILSHILSLGHLNLIP